MTHAEIDALMDGIAPAVHNYVVKSNAPLIARIDALEQTLGGLTSSPRERAVELPLAELHSTLDGKAMLANAIAGRQLARFGTTP